MASLVGEMKCDDIMGSKSQLYRESVESDEVRLASRIKTSSPVTGGINVLPASSSDKLLKLKNISVEKSKKGMIASLSRTFARAFETKSS